MRRSHFNIVAQSYFMPHLANFVFEMKEIDDYEKLSSD